MNSSPGNLPSSASNQNSASPNLKPLEDLISFLLDREVAEDDSLAKSEISDEHFDSWSENRKLSLETFKPLDSVDTGSHDPEIKVEIESELKPTLNQAVEYEAFLRQTVPKASNNQSANVSSLKQVTAIDTVEASTEELADVVNSLVPLIVELLQFKLEDSKERVIQTVRPVLDQLIEHRVAEDSPKMAAAIAKILPSAITAEIDLDPEAIARAIAPEIALSIKEQIRLDKNAIPQVLGPEMGKAIKAQIESERDAMVDALYPVIGSTISKYMVEVVQEINSKVESTLSPTGIKRKIRAKIQGVSEAELIFQESVGYQVQAIFLIDKDSGLVIQEIQQPGEKQLDSNLIAGMLTAIRSFANDCITSGSELDSIDYGDWQIPLEAAGYCYLAVVIKGEPDKQFRSKIRQVLGEIVLEYGDNIQEYDGNMATIPPAVRTKLEQLSQLNQDKSPKSSSSPALLWLILFLLGLVFIPWGIINYRTRVAQNIEQTAATQLDAAPELSVYRLESQVKDGKLTVSGRVPSEDLRDRAAVITQQIASRNNLQLDNQIATVNVPIDPSLFGGEIQRLTNLFNQQPTVLIETSYQAKTLTIKGFILDQSIYQAINQAFSQIPGVEQIIFEVARQLPMVKERIYFESDSQELDFADNLSKINAIEQLLNLYPQLHLNLAAYSDGRGSTKINQRLGKNRCQRVKTALVARGIEPTRLVANCDSVFLPSNAEDNQASRTLWYNRYVSFEPFIPTNLLQ
ncbi:MAG: BON domain-containing protein [Pleurocapsa sp.]